MAGFLAWCDVLLTPAAWLVVVVALGAFGAFRFRLYQVMIAWVCVCIALAIVQQDGQLLAPYGLLATIPLALACVPSVILRVALRDSPTFTQAGYLP